MGDVVMIVEDAPPIGRLVCAYLKRAGYDALWVRRGEDALVELDRATNIALVILDIRLPGIDGLEVCRRMGGTVPVIMLTALDEERDRIAGLELGADDYVTKPFSPRELIARVGAVLRRSGTTGDRTGLETAGVPARLELGPVSLDIAAREVYIEDREVVLTQREFDLLEYLVRHRGQVVTRDQLLEHVWDFRAPGQTRTIEVHVAQLRKKLAQPELIRTVRGLGYKISA